MKGGIIMSDDSKPAENTGNIKPNIIPDNADPMLQSTSTKGADMANTETGKVNIVPEIPDTLLQSTLSEAKTNIANSDNSNDNK